MAATLVLAAGLAACEDLGTGPEFDSTLQVLLRSDEGGAVAALSPAADRLSPALAVRPAADALSPALARRPPASDALEAVAGPTPPPETVGSVTLQVTRLEALPAGEPRGDPQAWVSLPVSREVDLLGLPAGGIELAAADVPAGRYTALRLIVPSASVELTATAPVGDASLPPGSYPASVPAGADFGAEVEGVDITVPEGAQGTLVVTVRVGPTLASLEWTGELFLLDPALDAGG